MERIARKDRIIVRRTTRKVDGDPAHILEVEHAESGVVILQCFIGDDVGAEGIADFLSAKRYPEAAARVRQLVRDARRAVVR